MSSAPTSSAYDRQCWASAQSRRRQRAKDGLSVFRLPLHSHLVAVILEAAGYQHGRDLTEHADCEAALAEWFHAQCVTVIDDSSDPKARAILQELLKPASKVAAA